MKERTKERLPSTRTPAAAIGAQAIGAQAIKAPGIGGLAIGTLADGAVAIGVIALGRLFINHLAIRRTSSDASHDCGDGSNPASRSSNRTPFVELAHAPIERVTERRATRCTGANL